MKTRKQTNLQLTKQSRQNRGANRAQQIAQLQLIRLTDFIPYLNWLDLQGINKRMKKIHKTFDEFAEKIIDDHVNHNPLMAAA
jgi:hypothetical protein